MDTGGVRSAEIVPMVRPPPHRAGMCKQNTPGPVTTSMFKFYPDLEQGLLPE